MSFLPWVYVNETNLLQEHRNLSNQSTQHRSTAELLHSPELDMGPFFPTRNSVTLGKQLTGNACVRMYNLDIDVYIIPRLTAKFEILSAYQTREGDACNHDHDILARTNRRYMKMASRFYVYQECLPQVVPSATRSRDSSDLHCERFYSFSMWTSFLASSI